VINKNPKHPLISLRHENGLINVAMNGLVDAGK
jgi:hypothetical protein